MVVKTGVYRHYKGAEYLVSGVAKHSETEEEVVIYRALYGDRGFWVRPLTMFVSSVCMKGQDVPRFNWIRESE